LLSFICIYIHISAFHRHPTQRITHSHVFENLYLVLTYILILLSFIYIYIHMCAFHRHPTQRTTHSYLFEYLHLVLLCIFISLSFMYINIYMCAFVSLASNTVQLNFGPINQKENVTNSQSLASTRVAVYRSVFQCTAVCCIVPQCVALTQEEKYDTEGTRRHQNIPKKCKRLTINSYIFLNTRILLNIHINIRIYITMYSLMYLFYSMFLHKTSMRRGQ